MVLVLVVVGFDVDVDVGVGGNVRDIVIDELGDGNGNGMIENG